MIKRDSKKQSSYSAKLEQYYNELAYRARAGELNVAAMQSVDRFLSELRTLVESEKQEMARAA